LRLVASSSFPQCVRPAAFFCRVGQNHMCTVYIRYCLAGESPNIWSYAVYTYTHGSGQPYSFALPLLPFYINQIKTRHYPATSVLSYVTHSSTSTAKTFGRTWQPPLFLFSSSFHTRLASLIPPTLLLLSFHIQCMKNRG